MSLISMVKSGIHMPVMSVVISVIHMSPMFVVIPGILLIGTMTSWIRKAGRTLPSKMVFPAINSTVTVSVSLSIYMFVDSIILSIQPFVRSVLGHRRRKHDCYQQNTCPCNYFFHCDFLLFSDLEFRAICRLRRVEIELVYKNKKRRVFQIITRE
jgi:hypothetical protein